MDWTARILGLLQEWAAHAEQYWFPVPGGDALGCYGTGYNAWGVQTNQKYVSAMAVLGSLGERTGAVPVGQCELAWARALAALRFSLHSHVSGELACTDGTQWGHTWISALGIERMMHGVYLLEPYMTDDDRDALRRVLTSESDWLLTDYHRGAHYGVSGDPWNRSGKNVPESNIWNGAVLWRTASTYPEHPHADQWIERAHRFLINGVSVPADAQDTRAVAGRPVSERFVGANFFPHYALDHHGYLNVGYMVICLSNAAMLHFDMAARGLPAPASLYHHQSDLWDVTRRFVFGDGRLARIGGDSRLRYTYCQEYLLPSLVYAAERFGDLFASQLLDGQLAWIEQEAAHNRDGDVRHRGSFYGRRLAPLTEQSPYYYTRLESDRACALGMTLAFMEHAAQRGCVLDGRAEQERSFEGSVAGTWCEQEHGAVLHRSPSRLASFAWRAHGMAQGICTLPDDGHLAEWWHNLVGVVRFLGDPGVVQDDQTQHRQLASHHVVTFAGGFATWGTVVEGTDLRLAEGWQGKRSATHHIAFVALPDGHTVVGLQLCRTDSHRTYVAEVKGLQLNLPNDLFNGFQRRVATADGELVLASPVAEDRIVHLAGPWANIEGRLGVVGLYGDRELVVHRSADRRGGKYASLYVDEICLCCRTDVRSLAPNTVVLDVGWAVLSGANAGQTQQFAQSGSEVDLGHACLRAILVTGLDGVQYVVAANLGEDTETIARPAIWRDVSRVQDLGRGVQLAPDGSLALAPGEARVLVLE